MTWSAGLLPALKALNIKKGDSVAILLPNVIPCVVAYYATLKIGGIVVLTSALFRQGT